MTDTKPEGPYFYQAMGSKNFTLCGPNGSFGLFTEDEAKRFAEMLNIAHAEGYKAGRASRDRLREALVVISSELYVNVDAATRIRQTSRKALAEDEKNG